MKSFSGQNYRWTDNFQKNCKISGFLSEMTFDIKIGFCGPKLVYSVSFQALEPRETVTTWSLNGTEEVDVRRTLRRDMCKPYLATKLVEELFNSYCHQKLFDKDYTEVIHSNEVLCKSVFRFSSTRHNLPILIRSLIRSKSMFIWCSSQSTRSVYMTSTWMLQS